MWRVLSVVSLCACAAVARECPLVPAAATAAKSPGDNHYRVFINEEIERYAPNQRYVVSLVGSRTHETLQQFTGFKMTLEPLDSATPRTPERQGQFQLFADMLIRFDESCTNSVVEASSLPKTEVLVTWLAPPAGSGCVLIKAMVYENSSVWFAEDGQLSRRVCEDTSLSQPDCCACDDATYEMEFEGLWSPENHPKDFPDESSRWLTHFSDVIGATHPTNFSFWGEGKIATDGFRMLAEWGSVGLLERELRQHGRVLRSLVKAPGLWYPRVNDRTSASFKVDRRRHLLSLSSMFGPSPDWVVGVNGLDLCLRNCSWVEHQVIDLYPYDAGTDNGISYLSPKSMTLPRERMYRITGMFPEDPRAPFYTGTPAPPPPLARLALRRVALRPRPCDTRQLEMALTHLDDDQDTDRPECAVSEWGEWSSCSVSCGPGLRARRRRYLAGGNGCGRQLIAKEMCLADVAECPSEGPQEEEGVEGTPEPDMAMCAVGPWGGWGPCSVSCGIGVKTRRRRFLNQMGYKKCPLIETEETLKCMEPMCLEPVETVDPMCPVGEWSAWSPCSATCGAGRAGRTRALLAAPPLAAGCRARVQLAQSRACKDQDCELDMDEAEAICLLPAEAGACRSLSPELRWAFDRQLAACRAFHYGGCRGNRNNFLTEQLCMDTCRGVMGPEAVDCEVGPWSTWSPCSVTCGRGTQQKTRNVTVPASGGGRACPRKMELRRGCSRRC